VNQPPEDQREEVEAEVKVETTIDLTSFAPVFERIATALEQIAYQLKQLNGKYK
jgi:hypothetical protein